MKITFHWVWSALNTSLDNTYFLIEDKNNNLQVDCGWWLWIAQKYKSKEFIFDNLFISHKHTDHLLWLFHLLRNFKKTSSNKLNIFCNKDVETRAKSIAKALWWSSNMLLFDETIVNFYILENSEELLIWDIKIIPIDLTSDKTPQHWFFLELNWKKILFFGDEAVKILGRTDLEKFIWIDYLICEALIPFHMSLEWWWEIDNKKISHITAREAWKIANKFKTKNLILVHTYEDKIWIREDELKKDAFIEFNWNIIVPKQWDILEF